MWYILAGFSIACIVASFLLSLLALKSAAGAAARLPDLQETRLRSIELRMESAAASLTETQEALQTVANKVKMMRVRAAATHTDEKPTGEPDPHREPDRWRDWMNTKIARKRVGV
jgi:hypothetical protein